jgi:hypothetical protein
MIFCLFSLNTQTETQALTYLSKEKIKKLKGDKVDNIIREERIKKKRKITDESRMKEKSKKSKKQSW